MNFVGSANMRGILIPLLPEAQAGVDAEEQGVQHFIYWL
jgi:hypothetical protein